jgi:hypothetical protein
MKGSEMLSIAACVAAVVLGCNRPSGGADPRTGSGSGATAAQQRPTTAPNDRLTLPGWEDVLVGNELPADARQNCTDTDTDGSQLPDHERMCKGCRSAHLPTPCVQVATFDAVHVDIISASLPDSDQQLAKIVETLHARWGAATSHGGTAGQLEWEQWDTQHESVMLATNFFDFSDCPQGVKNNSKCGRITKRPHTRVVTISQPVRQTKPTDGAPPTIGTSNAAGSEDSEVGASVDASSNTSGAVQLFDGDLGTSWRASNSDKAPWIEIDFKHPLTLTAVTIANGFQAKNQSGDEFMLNGRIENGRLHFSDGSEVTIHFEADERGLISFTLRPKRTTSVRLIVDATYPGTRSSEVAVSEIKVSADGSGAAPAATTALPTTAQDDQQAKDARCADLATKWCKDERYAYGSRLMAADQQICAQGGCQYPGQAVLPDTFDDRGCRSRLTKLCQRGRARFKVKPGRDPKGMFAWCVDIDAMDEWQCH